MLEAFRRGSRDGKTVGRYQERIGIKKGKTVQRKLLRRESLYNTNFFETTAYIIGHVIGELPQTFKFVLKDIVQRERHPTEIIIFVDKDGKAKLKK